MPSFEAAAAIFGVVLILGALVSGLAERSFLSLTALFVLAGFLVGDGGLRWVDFSAQSGFVGDLAFTALIVILFRDGLAVEGEMLQRAWRLPLRKLVLAMPITAALLALAAHLLFGLSWTEAFLLGALLSPTDPVLTSSIVTNPRVPRLIRHSLNLESGLNDGLALPAVLAFAAALSTVPNHFVWWRFVLQDVGLGFLFGIVCGLIGAAILPREPPPAAASRPGGAGAGADEQAKERTRRIDEGGGAGASAGRSTPSTGSALADTQRAAAHAGRRRRRGLFEHAIPAHQKSLFAIGVAFATYGVTVLSPHGNGFIAVFVAAIVLGVRRPDLVTHFERRATEIVEIVKLGIFLVFGSLLSTSALGQEGWVLVAFVAILFLLARPLAVWLSLIGTSTDTATRLFMGWFGPRGVATMTFSLLLLDMPITANREIFDIAAFVVLCSIIIHGATDTPGASWMARRAAGRQTQQTSAERS